MNVILRGTRGRAALPLSFAARLIALLAIFLAPVAAYAERLFVLWANHKGSEGTVKLSSNAIAEIRSWEMSVTNEMIEDTVLSDAARTFQSGNYTWTGSVSCFWDETDTNGQVALTPGASVTLNLYPEGDTTGDTYYTGTALVQSITRRAAINGMVEADFTFQGTGALATSTV
jgi:hypothetical protein